MTASEHHTILIASYLEPQHVERIRQVDSSLRVLYEPTLLRPPRYAADHTGSPTKRTADQEARWRGLLLDAEILFDFDQTHREDLPELAPNLRWIQATSAGIGQFVKRMAQGHVAVFPMRCQEKRNDAPILLRAVLKKQIPLLGGGL